MLPSNGLFKRAKPPMNLTKIARELGITPQELREELSKTNFGIDPNAKRIDDNLAKGVIRFLKGKVKPTRKKKRVAVILKGGKVIEEKVASVPAKEEAESAEEKPVKKEVKRAMTKKEREAMEQKKREAHGSTENKASERAHVPKNAPQAHQRDDAALKVSRRIELGKDSKKEVDTKNLPKHYYKSKNKKRRSRKKEEKELESLQRHPGRKVKIAKVHYEAGDIDERSAEEIAIEREMDRELFRSQKKNRATNLKSGHKAQPQIKAKTGVVEIPSILSLKEFAEKCGLPVTQVITTLMKNGVMATINQKLDYDTAALVADELGVDVKRQQEEASTEDLFAADIQKLLQEEEKSNLKKRPPVVSIMGHVDHGKTSLLDSIRNANVVAGESGGITQHIGAYQVKKNDELITFLDTPGHEAFTAMRARGAKATDIAILVVAADEGVKPQTIEAIHHAQEADIPIVVAINKMDKQEANPDRVKGELAEHGLQAEDWGGKTIMAPVSAQTGEGIDHLLEMILLVAEMEEFKANPNRLAVGTVVEAHLDKSLGPVATILINAGTLTIGDSIVIGASFGRIKAMHDHTGKSLQTAPPSAAVQISGLEKTPHAGDLLQVFKNERTAKKRVDELERLEHEREAGLSGSMVERIVSQINTGEMKFLKIVLKADTKGSLEAIIQALGKVKASDVAAKVIHFGVGNISATDVLMASASQALLIGFHVNAGVHVQKIAEREHIDIKQYTIIYKLIEDVKAILSGMMEPEINVIELGKVTIKEVFLDKRKWMIVGGEVSEGKVKANAMVRVKRGEELLFETQLESLKHVKEDVTQLEKGSECGMRLKVLKPLQPGDVLEAFEIEKIERNLD